MLGDALLLNTPVLVVDCQATGASPTHGHMLELGWATSAPCDAPLEAQRVTARLLSLPKGSRVPSAVTRLTGIGLKQLRDAEQSVSVWEELLDAVQNHMVCSQLALMPTVIHFARYELPFLRELHERVAAEQHFPLHVLCSHLIARRLLPDLPRCSLRALAGYFGMTTSPLRRATEHVVATAHVWGELLALLAEQDVVTFAQLEAWLGAPAPPSSRGRVYPMARAKRLAVPAKPGVYRLMRSNGDVLYVGKATSLKSRVNSYFQKQRKIPERTLEMLSQARDLDYTITPSALEACLLETDEIKRHQPPYNVALREAERGCWFATARFDLVASEPSDSHYVGPLPSREAVAVLGATLKLFAVRKSGGIASELAAAAVGAPRRSGPDRDCFAAGLALLRSKHDLPSGQSTPAALLRLGRRLWRLALGGEQQPNESDTTREDLAAERSWDPPKVVAALEHNIAQAARLIRRGRWLCRLSESTVAWREPDMDVGLWRVVVIEAGRVADSSFAEQSEPLALPIAARRPNAERQRVFDIATYDRLRVLNTELRRISSSAEPAAIRVGEHSWLQGQRLERMLRWV